MSSFMNVVNKYHRVYWVSNYHLCPLAKAYEMWINHTNSCFFPADCEIGEAAPFSFKGNGLFVHKRVDIWKYCMYAQSVTVGGCCGYHELPFLSYDRHIVAAAKALGPVRMENGVTIDADAVTMEDVPGGTVWGSFENAAELKRRSSGVTHHDRLVGA